MNRLTTLLTSLGIGAGLMYFYDPSRGNRRRAMVRDQVNSMITSADDAVNVAIRDARNRMRGVFAEGAARFSDEGAPDWILEERVRARIGRYSSHPGAIQVNADGGHIILSGPILKDEVDSILNRVASVRGVRGVENRLEIHERPEDIPGLQGIQATRKPRPEWAQENWSPSFRLLTGIGGGLLALYGMSRRGIVGTAASLAGLGLTARSVTNTELRSFLGMGTKRDTIRIQKAINIHTPLNEIYRFWSNPENFPRFMANVNEVQKLGGDRYHWKVIGPAGSEMEWDAIVTKEIPNERIEWESTPESEVLNAGMVHFQENPDGSTRITVHFHYTPPAGALGHAVATMFGQDPKHAMDEDLARLKTLFETGKTTIRGQEVTRPDFSSTY